MAPKSRTRAKKEKKVTRMDRAKKERMYFMGRAAAASDGAAAFIVTGQSGKVWTVTIPKKGAGAAASSSSRMSSFRCNCPDSIFRKRTCKHMLFVCLRVLKISEEQLKGLEGGGVLDLGFLHEVVERVAPEVDEEYCAPAALKERLKKIAGDFETNGTVPKVEPRIPDKDEDCPICCDHLLDGSPLVHCGYGCGKPVHVECFERYKQAQNNNNGREIADSKLRCVICRMDWVVEHSGVIGNRGMLLGRRAIDLAQAMPEQFVTHTTSTLSSKSRSKSKSKSKTTKRQAQNTKTKGGRVTKAKTQGARKSSRIANRNSIGNTNNSDGDENALVAPQEEQHVVAVESAEPLSKRKSARNKNSKNNSTPPAKAAIKKNRRNSGAVKRGSSTGWANAVDATADADDIEREISARNARAARRSAGNTTRHTRSQTA